MNKRSILPLLTVGVASLTLAACVAYPQGGSYPNQAYAAPGYGYGPTPVYESDYPPPAYGYGGSAVNVVVPLGHEHDDHFHGGDFHHGGDDHHGGPPAAFHQEGGHGGGGGGGFHPQHAATPAAPAGHEHGGGGHGAPQPNGGGQDHDHGHG